jgi:hypothetical protein
MFLQRGGTTIVRLLHQVFCGITPGWAEIPCILKFEGKEKDVAKVNKINQYEDQT